MSDIEDAIRDWVPCASNGEEECDANSCVMHAKLAELASLRAKLATYQGLAHSATLSTRGYCDTCERGYDMREGCAESCPWCEADALREQVKTARIEGAREAWRIAFPWVFEPYGKSVARERYSKAFGEEAPQ